MSDDFAALNSFSGTARLFPLPNVVLFPQAMLPLHIFEPRYREMTAAALAGDRLIAIVLLKPGFEADYEGRPEIHSMACLGIVVADQKLEDGRYNLLLRGLSRARIIEEVDQSETFRSAHVELLAEALTPQTVALPPLRAELERLVTTWFATMGLAADQLQKLLQGGLPLGALTDILSFALPLAMPAKQELLEELTVEQRARRLIHHLQSVEPPPSQSSLPRRFPPDFSPN